MCLICIEFQAGRMRASDARNALVEARAFLSPEHIREVEELIEEDESDE